MRDFKSFKEFYSYYLTEHDDRTSRRLHFVGSTLVITILIVLAITGRWGFWWAIPIAGYGFAWAGHFFFEKNRPATFRHPLYSLMGDFRMYFDILRGKIKF